ncbi:MAG: hypothetical protein LBV17_11690 [Treponema sp.]|jgi:hypothetical protein|nr:hypothetical protein [Treponema sp.]
MKKVILSILLLSAANFYVKSDEINFPPELLWWINEVKKANPRIEINDFKLFEKETRYSNRNYLTSAFLVYPVFMRWNYSGNIVAYYNFNDVGLKKQKNGKYIMSGGDIDSHFVFADRNKKIFFHDSFGSSLGIDAYNWLTDTVLIAVGTWINTDEKDSLIIKIYTISNLLDMVEIKTYIYENALTSEDRINLKSNWVEQRADYFEIK